MRRAVNAGRFCIHLDDRARLSFTTYRIAAGRRLTVARLLWLVVSRFPKPTAPELAELDTIAP